MKMHKAIYGMVVLVCFAFAKAYSQESPQPLLTREQAVALMLENNYNIKIAQNQELIADNNQGLLNSGYLPSLQGTAGINITQLQVRSTIENTTVQLMSVYLENARLTENVNVFQQNLEISKKREERARYQFEFGQVNKLEVLNARVDINTDSINLMNAQQQLRNSKRDLNLILNRELTTQFEIDTLVNLENMLLIESFLEKVADHNVTLLQAESNVTISDYDIKTTRALLLPRIGLIGTYGWNETQNPPSAFFPATVRTASNVAVGANLTWNIFDGGLTLNSMRNAKIAYQNEQLLKQQLEQEVARDIANAKDQTYVEDCEVCCNPIELQVSFEDGELVVFEAREIGQ